MNSGVFEDNNDTHDENRIADDLGNGVLQRSIQPGVFQKAVVEQLVAARSGRADSALDRLSPREREVLEQMALGKNNAAIAAALFLTERAVEKHTNAIFGKLGFAEEPDLNRRVAAVLMFLQKQ